MSKFDGRKRENFFQNDCFQLLLLSVEASLNPVVTIAIRNFISGGATQIARVPNQNQREPGKCGQL